MRVIWWIRSRVASWWRRLHAMISMILGWNAEPRRLRSHL